MTRRIAIAALLVLAVGTALLLSRSAWLRSGSAPERPAPSVPEPSVAEARPSTQGWDLFAADKTIGKLPKRVASTTFKPEEAKPDAKQATPATEPTADEQGTFLQMVPEPDTLLLVALGLAGLAQRGRRSSSHS